MFGLVESAPGVLRSDDKVDQFRGVREVVVEDRQQYVNMLPQVQDILIVIDKVPELESLRVGLDSQDENLDQLF